LASGTAPATEALTAHSRVAALDERILALQQEAEMRRAELARWIGADAERPLAGIPSDLDLGTTPEALVSAVPQHPPLAPVVAKRSEEHTSELQSRFDLVCRLLLEKKKKKNTNKQRLNP